MEEIIFASGSVPVAVAARVYGKDASWIRAGIVSGWLPIGKATRSGKLVTNLEEMSICSVHPSHGQSMNSEKGHISNGLHMKSVIESWTSLSTIQSPSSKTSCSRWLCMLVTARMSSVALYFRMRSKQLKN